MKNTRDLNQREPASQILYLETCYKLISSMIKSISVKVVAQPASFISKPKEKNLPVNFTFYTIDIEPDYQKVFLKV